MPAATILSRLKSLATELSAELNEARQQSLPPAELEKMEKTLATVNSAIGELEQAEGRIRNFPGQYSDQFKSS